MIIHFVRHGISLANVMDVFSTPDTPLIKGEHEELDNAKRFVAENRFDKKVVSPFLRTRQTAEIIGVKDYETDERIQEISMGIFEGLNNKEAEQRYPEIYADFRKDVENHSIPGSENVHDVYKRVSEFLDEIPTTEGRMIVVSHYVVIGCAIAWALDYKNITSKIMIHNGSITTINKSENGTTLVMR